jgi:hypothetical protein
MIRIATERKVYITVTLQMFRKTQESLVLCASALGMKLNLVHHHTEKAYHWTQFCPTFFIVREICIQ